MKESLKDTNWMRKFIPFWLSQLLSMLGSMLVQFTLVWWLTEKTGSAGVLATATLFGMLPELIIQPFAGAIVDRLNRKAVIIVADVIIAVATLGLALSIKFGHTEVWLVYGIMALRGIGSAFHYPAQQASVALMVPETQLARISGLNQAARGIMNIVSAPMGALILEFMDVEGALFIDVITAAIAVTIISFVAIPKQQVFNTKEKNWISTTIVDLRDGLRYLLRWKALVVLMLIIFIYKIALVPAFSLIPLFVYQELQGSVAQYSIIEVAAGVGFIIGGLVLSAWGGFKKHIHTIILGGFGVGIGILVIGFLPKGAFFWMVSIIFFIAFMIPIIDGPIVTVFQTKIANSYQGRVTTLFGTIGGLSGQIGLAIAGGMSETFGLRFWFISGGGLIILLLFLGMFNKDLMRIDEGPDIDIEKLTT